MTPAVGYMRCSSKGSLGGDTWQRQGSAIQACVISQGFELVGEYREEAIPGKFDEDQRPAFQRMIADLIDGETKVIIVESLDRLAREYRIQEHLITYLASKGLTLISANTGENITEAMMGDPMKRALVQIQGILAELDKNMIVAKLRKARQRLRTKNGKCEGRKRFGSRPGEESALSYMTNWELDGLTSQEIADQLNALGCKTRYGKAWNGGTVWKILKRQAKLA